MYEKYLNSSNHFSKLLQIFGKIFNSQFLKTLLNNEHLSIFTYLLSKKVRLQDIERAYNNYEKILSLDVENQYYKFCLDYSFEMDNYDYLAQNIETIKYLIQSWFFMELLWEKTPKNLKWENTWNIISNILTLKNFNYKQIITPEILIKLLNNILNFTWWYLTISMVKWYIEEERRLEDLLEESKEAKKEVLSPNPIAHFNLATYETIFLAYRPTGFTIDTIQQNIENGNIADMSHHLEWIQFHPDWYEMEFFQRSYSLEWWLNETIVNWIDQLLKWRKAMLYIENLWEENNSSVLSSFNTKLFFSTSTNLFSKNESNLELNNWIFSMLRDIYALNQDSRIEAYKNNFVDGNFSYERLSELREIFAVVTKDSFDTVIWNEISRLSEEEQQKIWENIWKLKDKNLKAKYSEINANDISIHEKIKEIFIWRLLWYASQIRKYINVEMKKFKEVKGQQSQVKAQLSKNIGSFFAKAGAGLCTSENYEMWKEKRHIHLNLIDEQKQEIIGNVMLYFEPGRNYLVARGFNPRTDIESSYDVNHMVDEMIRVVKEIAVQNWYIDENWEALVYIPPQDSTHLVSNREKVRKRMKYIVWKVWEELKNVTFYSNIEWERIRNTLHRI